MPKPENIGSRRYELNSSVVDPPLKIYPFSYIFIHLPDPLRRKQRIKNIDFLKKGHILGNGMLRCIH